MTGKGDVFSLLISSELLVLPISPACLLTVSLFPLPHQGEWEGGGWEEREKREDVDEAVEEIEQNRFPS